MSRPTSSSVSSPNNGASPGGDSATTAPAGTDASPSPPSREGVPAVSVPSDLAAVAASLPASPNASQRNGSASPRGGSSRRRRRRKPPPPPQAHAEPRGADEAEARMMWNRIAPLPGQGRVTLPTEPATTYNAASASEIPGGLRALPSVAMQTLPFEKPVPNLVHLANGPLSLFVKEGAHPRVGWVSDALLLPKDLVGVREEENPSSVSSRRGGGGRSSSSTRGGPSAAATAGDANNSSEADEMGTSMRSSDSGGRGVRAFMRDRHRDQGMTDPFEILQLLQQQSAGATSTGLSSSVPSSPLSGASSPLLSITSPPKQQQRNFAPTGENTFENAMYTTAGGAGGRVASSFGAPATVFPVPPEGPGQRVAQHSVSDGTAALAHERHLEECTQWMLDLATAVGNERQLFAQARQRLGEEVKALQAERAETAERQELVRTKEQQRQRAQLILRDDDLQRLDMARARVLDCLDEKKRVQRELTETSVAVEKAEGAATLSLLEEEDRLREARRKLENMLRSKLTNAVEQMAQLSDAQRKARESTTAEDFARLAGELAEQERKMRDLNSASGKLQSRIASLRREISLEAQRGQILQEKQDAYHASISTLVRRLEDIERKYAAQSQRELKGVSGLTAAASASSAAPDPNHELPRIIDQQYSVILQLRADLVRVRQEVAEATALLKKERAALVQTANPSVQPILPRQPHPPQGAIEAAGAGAGRRKVSTSNSSTTSLSVVPPPRNTSATSGGGGADDGHGTRPGTTASTAASTVMPFLPGDLLPQEAAFVRHIVFEALHDADENLAPVVGGADGATKKKKKQQQQQQVGGSLPPVYATLESLDPQQRCDVFDFVVRRINTKLLNPMRDDPSVGMSLSIV